MVIPGPGSSGGVASGHGRGGGPPAGRGGVPVGGGPAGSRSGTPVNGHGGATGSSSAVAPGKGKQMCGVLDDDEVLSDEDEPLQKRMRQHSDIGPAVLNEVAVADKEVVDKRATEEATTKAAAAEDVAGKTADEAAGAAGGSPAPGQAPSAAGAKRAATPSGSTPPAKCPYRGVWKPRFVEFSLPLFSLFYGASFSYYLFYPGPLPPARPP
jgi:hypothetical protein